MKHRGIEAKIEQIRAIHVIPSPRNVKEVQRQTCRMAAQSRFISKLSDKSHAFFKTLKNPKEFQGTDKCKPALTELKAYLTTPPLLSKPLDGETLLLYLAVSVHAVSAVLVREEGNKSLPVFYVGKSLFDAKTLEKLAVGVKNGHDKVNIQISVKINMRTFTKSNLRKEIFTKNIAVKSCTNLG